MLGKLISTLHGLHPPDLHWTDLNPPAALGPSSPETTSGKGIRMLQICATPYSSTNLHFDGFSLKETTDVNQSMKSNLLNFSATANGKV